MSITFVDQWLQNAGYEYHCFISWPHTKDTDVSDCAKYVKDRIEQSLASLVPNPKVFIDETGITVADDWEETLGRALCRSVAMVAICTPMYYHREHRWCGIEWATMHALSAKRLPGKNFKAIIPLLARKSDPLPQAVQKVQYADLSKILTRSRRFHTTNEFRERMQTVTDNCSLYQKYSPRRNRSAERGAHSESAHNRA
jgi:hypothetical protein